MQRYSPHLRSCGLSLLALLFAPLFGLWSSVAEAARITTVKGSSVAIDLEGTEADYAEGDKYYVMIDGKRKAIVQITKVKGSKALGKILKGKAAVDGTLASTGSAKHASENGASQHKKTSGLPFTELTLGFLGGFAMDSQSVTVTNGETANMTGIGFSVKAFGDLPIAGSLGLTARAGIEQFNVKGTTSAGSQTTEIMYATADLLLRYLFVEGSFAPFATAGLALHFPVSKKSDILNVQRISSTSVFIGGLGFNFAFSNTMYAVVLGEYGLFPPSNEVKTNYITGRAGLGFRF